MTKTEFETLTPSQMDAYMATIPTVVPCPACKGTSQDEGSPDCAACDSYAWLSNPDHPENW